MIPIIQLAKSHLLLLAVILAVASFAGYLYIDRAAQHAHDETILAQHQLQDVLKANADLQAAIAKRDAEIDKRDELLAKAIASRNTILVQQQKQDTQLKPTDLGNRFAQLSGAKPEEVQADAVGNFQVTNNAILSSVIQLEKVPVLEANVADLNSQLSDRDVKISERDQQIVSDKQVLASQIDADNKKYHELQVKARRSKLRWFGAGVVVGFIGRNLVHI